MFGSGRLATDCMTLRDELKQNLHCFHLTSLFKCSRIEEFNETLTTLDFFSSEIINIEYYLALNRNGILKYSEAPL